MAAADYARQWQKANELYAAKSYDSAAYYYEQIASSKPSNAQLYYNLGNTYYRLNKIAPAVLNYERALRTDPDYMAAKDNLVLTQSRISNSIPSASDVFFVSWWARTTHANKATTWAIAALLAFALMLALILTRRLTIAGRHIARQLPGIVAFVWICLLVLAIASAVNTASTRAVVMAAEVPLLNNEQKGKPLAYIPEGTTVSILSEKTGWTEVRLPDGRTGWLQTVAITRI